MSYDLEDYRYDSPLPTDITHRVPVYRRKGVIASLLLTAIAIWSARRQLNRVTRWYRAQASSAEVPDYLREDIGLPPLPKRLPNWWELPR